MAYSDAQVVYNKNMELIEYLTPRCQNRVLLDLPLESRLLDIRPLRKYSLETIFSQRSIKSWMKLRSIDTGRVASFSVGNLHSGPHGVQLDTVRCITRSRHRHILVILRVWKLSSLEILYKLRDYYWHQFVTLTQSFSFNPRPYTEMPKHKSPSVTISSPYKKPRS